MLQQNCWLLPESEKALLLDAKHVEDIAIICLDSVALVGKPVRLHQLLETLEVVCHQDRDLVVHTRIAVFAASSFRFITRVLHFSVVLPNKRNILPNALQWSCCLDILLSSRCLNHGPY